MKTNNFHLLKHSSNILTFCIPSRSIKPKAGHCIVCHIVICYLSLCYMLLYTVQEVQDGYIDISVLYAKATNVRITLFQIVGREGPTVSTTPPQLDQSNMSLLNLKFKRRKVDSRDSDGKTNYMTQIFDSLGGI